MHFYRICLALLHTLSAFTYLPHLITHVFHLPFQYIPIRSQIAYIVYWINYCLFVIGILIWCLIVVCRQKTTYHVMQVSGLLLIGKLVYTSLELIVRILLQYKMAIIVFDIVHIILLIPAVLITFLLVRQLKENTIKSKKLQQLLDVEQGDSLNN